MSNRRLQTLVRFAFAAGSCVPFSTALADPNTPAWNPAQMNGSYVRNQFDTPVAPGGFNGGQNFQSAHPADSIFARGMQLLQRDPRAAAEQFGQAARMGHPMAQLNLGVMCFNGEGMAPNPAEAYVWYSLAARGGVQQAVQYARDAAGLLNPQQRAAADQRIQQLAGASAGQAASGQAGGGQWNGGQQGKTYDQAMAERRAWEAQQRQRGYGPNGGPYPPNGVTPPNNNFGGMNRPTGAMGGNPGGNFGAMNVPNGHPGGGTLNATGGATAGAAGVAGTEVWDLGFFKMQKPRGWKMTAAGQGAGFCFLGEDPTQPNRQFFQFGSIGPVFPSEADKQAFGQIMQFSPQPVAWQQMAVVSPLDPANLLQHFEQIARHPNTQQAFPRVPVPQNLQIISREPAPHMLPDPSAKSELLRARFLLNGQPCEGVFCIITSMIQGDAGMGVPSYGVAMMMGITAPAGELAGLEGPLNACLKSQKFSESYMQSQRAAAQAALKGARDRSNLIAETGDYVRNLSQKTWDYQNKMGDIGQQQFTDYMRGTERMYNPETGEMLEFNQGFHDDIYNLNRNQFEMNNLQQVPYDINNYNRLMQPALDGYREIR